MGIWKPSPASQQIARTHKGLQSHFQNILPDLKPEDTWASPYAVFEYTPNPEFINGFEELLAFKKLLESKGKKLLLDFVPNHVAVDSPYITEHPDVFLLAEDDVSEHNRFLHHNGRFYAHGKDPYFDGWTDTIQFDFSKLETTELQTRFLENISGYCHGVRCDMAMLPLKTVFEKTHGKPGADFWEKIVPNIKKIHPGFVFVGEVYWELEYTLQQLGFDYTYDKKLYDRLKTNDPTQITSHLKAEENFQNHSLRFLENHDEERSFETFGANTIPYFALLCFLPGMVLSYEGQTVGRKQRLPVQLSRLPEEAPNNELKEIYNSIFSTIVSRNKTKKLERRIFSFETYEEFRSELIVYGLVEEGTLKELLVLNPYKFVTSGWVHLKEFSFSKDVVQFQDVLTKTSYEKSAQELKEKGVYFQLGGFSSHWFVVGE